VTLGMALHSQGVPVDMAHTLWWHGHHIEDMRPRHDSTLSGNPGRHGTYYTVTRPSLQT